MRWRRRRLRVNIDVVAVYKALAGIDAPESSHELWVRSPPRLMGGGCGMTTGSVAIGFRIPARAAAVLALSASVALAAGRAPAPAESPSDVLARSAPGDWRALDPESTLYMGLPAGRVVIELAPQFAPGHVANIKALVRAHYFDGLHIIRVQDNYVVQWGDPDGKRDTGTALRPAPTEFYRPLQRAASFRQLQDRDVYAPRSISSTAGRSRAIPAQLRNG